eukprot:SAG31_NODE_2861_length_4987_cov_105.905278_3_plen_98_part_00
MAARAAGRASQGGAQSAPAALHALGLVVPADPSPGGAREGKGGGGRGKGSWRCGGQVRGGTQEGWLLSAAGRRRQQRQGAFYLKALLVPVSAEGSTG